MRTIPPEQTFFAEQNIKRSRFLSHLRRCEDEATARAFIEEIRSQYSDARHNCTAFILANSSGGPALGRSSDDGEPAGTAGMPMLEVLNGSGLVNLCCVVTRYFGGIKLGTGGLVRAYSSSVQQVLALTPIHEIKEYPTYRLQVPLPQAGRFLSQIQNQGYQLLEQDWQADLNLRLLHPDLNQDEIEKQLSALLASTVIISPDQSISFESPVNETE